MTRSSRLLELLQLLREHKYAVTASQLKTKLNVSERTIYRDINTLRAQGAIIDGCAGTGYLLKESLTLPPLTFTEDELLVISLGLKWVKRNTDDSLVVSAQRVIAKIGAVISPSAKIQLYENAFTVINSERNQIFIPEARKAITLGLKLEIEYIDLKNNVSNRIVWPCALGYFEQSAMLACWCELRKEFRNFRIDRIKKLEILDRFPISTHALLKKWRDENNIDLD